LVEICSAAAFSSTRALTDCGSRRLIRAIGSSSGSEVGSSTPEAGSADSDSGTSSVGSDSTVGTDTTNSGS
jgi:hypothetical protein